MDDFGYSLKALLGSAWPFAVFERWEVSYATYGGWDCESVGSHRQEI